MRIQEGCGGDSLPVLSSHQPFVRTVRSSPTQLFLFPCALSLCSFPPTLRLQAICVRSSEGRKRIINEVVATLLLGSGTATASNTTTMTTTTTTHAQPASAGATPGAAPGSATGPGAGAGGQGLAAPSLAIEFSAEEKALALAPVECSVGVSAAGAFMQRPGCPHPIKVRSGVCKTALHLLALAGPPKACRKPLVDEGRMGDTISSLPGQSHKHSALMY